jgi:hypothetical protein
MGGKGSAGTKGLQGLQDPQATQGTQETQGLLDLQGIQGIKDLQDLQDLQGLQGLQGIRGHQDLQVLQVLQATGETAEHRRDIGFRWLFNNGISSVHSAHKTRTCRPDDPEAITFMDKAAYDPFMCRKTKPLRRVLPQIAEVLCVTQAILVVSGRIAGRI